MVKEINQTNKFCIINIDECNNIYYVLSPFQLKDTNYSNCIGMENIFVAKHYIERSGNHFTISYISKNIIDYPLEDNTETNTEISTKLKINKNIKNIFSST